MNGRKNNNWTVYTHTSPSGKVYVGISKDLKDRWANQGAKYCSYDSIFKHAIRKYGWNNLEHKIILEDRTKSEAIYAEKYLIRWYKMHNMSYNITDGGEGTSGMIFSEERIQKARNVKIANNNNVYLIIDKEFNYKVFTTITEAAAFIGTKRTNVSSVLNQPIGYTCKGYYIWRYEKNASIDIEDIKRQILSAKEERHQKISEAVKARVSELNASSRAAIVKMSPEEKKIKYATYGMRGKHHSEEVRRKMSESAKGRDMSKAIEASRHRSHDYVPKKPIQQLDLNGNIINEFPSITAAKQSLGKTSNSIVNCLTGRTKMAFGYRWEYKSIGGQ